MLILSIETSCDETGAAVIETGSKLKIISNVLSSSINLHAKTGGIIPEVAAREQTKLIIPVVKEALKEKNVDAIAVTVGPGLMGSLLVGVETAKALSYSLNIPIIPVNHLLGHIYANWLVEENLPLPALGLVVSGGHTDLILLKDHGNIKWLGGTRDDAAGEAFDKIGRLLNLPYPGGPAIEKESEKIKDDKFKFPRPLIDSDDFDFSFSGLKTAVFREVKNLKMDEKTVSEISKSVQDAVVDTLVTKTINAAKKLKVKSIVLGGGVAANQKLREELKSKSSVKLFIPPKFLCTDNAAMIGAAAFYNQNFLSWRRINANPNLHFA